MLLGNQARGNKGINQEDTVYIDKFTICRKYADSGLGLCILSVLSLCCAR